ncbi:hypothetical protein FRB94_003920 [Tulasnella sp. JGI-2019a]|nr:hypothetical protein FRB94_003920 [Tulasnella sp. JGI-2019a]
MASHTTQLKISASAKLGKLDSLNFPAAGSTSKSAGRQSAKSPMNGAFSVGSLPPPVSQSKAGEENLSRLEPDQMFARFSVSEVKALQARLRSEADSKQEELRVMVGERYRDLLQASSSIESISESSQRVRNALEDMKEGCSTSKDIRALKTRSHKRQQSLFGGALTKGSASAEDSQLITLQSLAAHLKLLLDTPEQLWRLLERKRYLQAAWLYLLARVVYRALTYDEDDGDEHDMEWAKDGIQVADQFPLAQRQWDTISTFRSQIAYRASQSLRDYPPTVPATSVTKSPHTSSAETLLSILLLDSLPISETLSLFLSQRTKTLQAVYAGIENAPQTPAISKSRRKNQELAASLLRSPYPPSTPLLAESASAELSFRFPLDSFSQASANGEQSISNKRKDKVVKRVRQSLRRVVNLLGTTVAAVKEIFAGSNGAPLIAELLENTTTGSTSRDAAKRDGQSNVLDTPFLLSTLPSSTLLVRYLPASIQSYAPYIDTDSPSSQLPPVAVASATSSWFTTSLQSLEDRLSTWLQDLDDLRDVWGVWTSLQFGHLPESGKGSLELFTERERENLLSLVQHACQRRVREVWRDKLADVEGAIVREVQRGVDIMRSDTKANQAEVDPSAFHFSHLALSSSGDSLLGSVYASAALKKCKDALQQRVANRTPLVGSVLTHLEALAKDLNTELASLEGPGGRTREAAGQLMTEYVTGAKQSVAQMAQSLENLVQKETNYDPPSKMDADIAIFIGKVALELVTESPFIADLIPGENDLKEFRSTMSNVHNRSLDQWRACSITAALDDWRRIFSMSNTMPPHSVTPSAPSNGLIQSLMKLASSMQALGFSKQALEQKHVERRLLEAFASTLVAETPSELGLSAPQILWDLTFLSKICSEAGSNVKELSSLLKRVSPEGKSSTSSPETKEASNRLTSTVDLQFARNRLLLGPLLPSNRATSTLVPTKPALNRGQSGTLTSHVSSVVPGEQDLQLAVEVAKPGLRFGMLLIGGTNGRP